MKLMIVEDNEPMRVLLHGLVGDLAEQVWECGDGLEACRVFAEHRPDWVLMDIQLPGVNGLEATRSIREKFPEANIVIVTGYTDEELREQARLAGAREYVLKDNLTQLRPLLSRALDPIGC